MSAPRPIRFIPGNWLEPFEPTDLFDEPRALEVDVGCGKGRFLLEHAANHPERHFLGIDRMLRRLRKVIRRAERRGLDNLRVLRLDAYYAVAYLLPPASVAVYYIFFPDPWPKKKHHGNRLFDGPFLDALVRTLRPDGCLHFATDHLPYYEEVRSLLEADGRFEAIEPYVPLAGEKTDFELIFSDQPIGRCSFQRSRQPALPRE